MKAKVTVRFIHSQKQTHKRTTHRKRAQQHLFVCSSTARLIWDAHCICICLSSSSRLALYHRVQRRWELSHPLNPRIHPRILLPFCISCVRLSLSPMSLVTAGPWHLGTRLGHTNSKTSKHTNVFLAYASFQNNIHKVNQSQKQNAQMDLHTYKCVYDVL